MNLLVLMTANAVRLLLYGLLGIIVMQMLSGNINLRGLLRDSTGKFTPERVQLLLFTLGAAGQYLATVVKNPHLNSLPPVEESWVAVVTASNAIYLARKAYNKYWANQSI